MAKGRKRVQPKPIYKKVWFWAVIVLVLGIVGILMDMGKEELTLDIKDSYTTDKDGNVEISGKTLPKSEISIGFGILNDTIKADDKGNFGINYKLSSNKEKKIDIYSRLDSDSIKTTTTIVPSSEFASSKGNNFETDQSKMISDQKEKQNKDSKKKAAEEVNLNEMNNHLNETLSFYQSLALGIVDADNNPVDNGTPDEDKTWSLVVSSVKYDSENSIDVQVTQEFVDSSVSEKDTIASRVQSMAKGAKLYSDKTDDDNYLKTAPHATFYLGENAVGNSKALDSESFKW